MSELSDNSFFTEIKNILAEARGSAVRAVNTAMVEAYWQIGRRIVEEEQGGSVQALYGVSLLKELSRNLTEEFGHGFSLANLKNFRKFYLTCPEGQKSYALRSLLSWTHHRSIMRVDDPEARQYYVETCVKENWSSSTLDRQIKTNAFQISLTLADGGRTHSRAGKGTTAPCDEQGESRMSENSQNMESSKGVYEAKELLKAEVARGFEQIQKGKTVKVNSEDEFLDLVRTNGS